jgi:hypothetical protein
LILPSADEIVQGLTTWQVQIYKLRGHTETDHPEVDKEVPEIIFKVLGSLRQKMNKYLTMLAALKNKMACTIIAFLSRR